MIYFFDKSGFAVLASQQIQSLQMTRHQSLGIRDDTLLYENPRSKVPIFLKINQFSTMHVQKNLLDSSIS